MEIGDDEAVVVVLLDCEIILIELEEMIEEMDNDNLKNQPKNTVSKTHQ